MKYFRIKFNRITRGKERLDSIVVRPFDSIEEAQAYADDSNPKLVNIVRETTEAEYRIYLKENYPHLAY